MSPSSCSLQQRHSAASSRARSRPLSSNSLPRRAAPAVHPPTNGSALCANATATGSSRCRCMSATGTTSAGRTPLLAANSMTGNACSPMRAARMPSTRRASLFRDVSCATGRGPVLLKRRCGSATASRDSSTECCDRVADGRCGAGPRPWRGAGVGTTVAGSRSERPCDGRERRREPWCDTAQRLCRPRLAWSIFGRGGDADAAVPGA